jgi:hypothetical protein
MLDSWREESARESQRMRHLWELAEGAHKRLPHMTPQEQKEMLDLLDIRVTVLEHEGHADASQDRGGRRRPRICERGA